MTNGHHGPEGVDCHTDASGLVQLLLGELRFFYSKPPVSLIKKTSVLIRILLH